jgi:hypothetical protein
MEILEDIWCDSVAVIAERLKKSKNKLEKKKAKKF